MGGYGKRGGGGGCLVLLLELELEMVDWGRMRKDGCERVGVRYAIGRVYMDMIGAGGGGGGFLLFF